MNIRNDMPGAEYCNGTVGRICPYDLNAERPHPNRVLIGVDIMEVLWTIDYSGLNKKQATEVIKEEIARIRRYSEEIRINANSLCVSIEEYVKFFGDEMSVHKEVILELIKIHHIPVSLHDLKLLYSKF